MVVAELLRMAFGERRYEVIDGNLRDLTLSESVASEHFKDAFNPSSAYASPSV